MCSLPVCFDVQDTVSALLPPVTRTGSPDSGPRWGLGGVTVKLSTLTQAAEKAVLSLLETGKKGTCQVEIGGEQWLSREGGGLGGLQSTLRSRTRSLEVS